MAPFHHISTDVVVTGDGRFVGVIPVPGVGKGFVVIAQVSALRQIQSAAVGDAVGDHQRVGAGEAGEVQGLRLADDLQIRLVGGVLQGDGRLAEHLHEIGLFAYAGSPGGHDGDGIAAQMIEQGAGGAGVVPSQDIQNFFHFILPSSPKCERQNGGSFHCKFGEFHGACLMSMCRISQTEQNFKGWRVDLRQGRVTMLRVCYNNVRNRLRIDRVIVRERVRDRDRVYIPPLNPPKGGKGDIFNHWFRNFQCAGEGRHFRRGGMPRRRFSGQAYGRDRQRLWQRHRDFRRSRCLGRSFCRDRVYFSWWLLSVGRAESPAPTKFLLRSYMPGRATREAVVEISMEGSERIFS